MRLMMKRLAVILIMSSCVACSTIQQNKKLSYIITGGNSQAIRFDVTQSTQLTKDDSRIKSIVLASRQNNTAQIHIVYSSFRGEMLANKIAECLLDYHIHVLTPEPSGIMVNNKFETNKVLVITHFDSLLKQ